MKDPDENFLVEGKYYPRSDKIQIRFFQISPTEYPRPTAYCPPIGGHPIPGSPGDCDTPNCDTSQNELIGAMMNQEIFLLNVQNRGSGQGVIHNADAVGTIPDPHGYGSTWQYKIHILKPSK
jgi:hypothetical protein